MKTDPDIPVNIGDIVYEANKKSMQVYSHIIARIDLREYIIVYWNDGQSNKDFGYLYYDTFPTHSEAKKKLEEINK